VFGVDFCNIDLFIGFGLSTYNDKLLQIGLFSLPTTISTLWFPILLFIVFLLFQIKTLVSNKLSRIIGLWQKSEKAEILTMTLILSYNSSNSGDPVKAGVLSTFWIGHCNSTPFHNLVRNPQINPSSKLPFYRFRVLFEEIIVHFIGFIVKFIYKLIVGHIQELWNWKVELLGDQPFGSSWLEIS